MDLARLSHRFEKLSVTARLQDTAYFMPEHDEAARIQLVQAVLSSDSIPVCTSLVQVLIPKEFFH